MRRLSVLLLLLLLAPFALLAEEKSRGVDFTVRIPVQLRVKDIETPRRLTLSANDVARGMVDLEEASVVSLQTNCRSGVSVTSNFARGDIERVEFRLDRNDPIAESAHLGFWGMEPRIVRVGYRLFLKPGATAGERDWPVSLRFSNCA